MEKSSFENLERDASYLMRNDYFNEYTLLFHLLTEGFDEENRELLVPESFSKKYPNMTYNNIPFSVSEIEKQKIKELDELATEVNSLINDSELNKEALLKITMRVAEICERPDVVKRLEVGLTK